MSSNAPPPARRGEILPPLPRAPVDPLDVSQLPQGLFSTSMFARARYASEQKQIEAYHRLVAAKTQLGRALNEQQRVIIEHVELSARAESLDTIRAVARLKVSNEFTAITQETDRLRDEGELGALERTLRKERLEYEIAVAKRAREQLGTQSTGGTKPKSVADRIHDTAKEVDEIEHAFAEMKAEAVARYGSEADLPDDVRKRLNNFELMRNSMLDGIMTDML